MQKGTRRQPRPIPAVSRPRSTVLDPFVWLLEAGLLCLATWFGLQELRVFAPTLVYTLGDLAPPAFVVGFALGLVALMWVAPLLWRAFGAFGAWVFPVGGLAVLRLLEQWSLSPLLDLVFSGVAVVCLAVLTVVAPQHEQATGRGARGMGVWPWALGAGLLVDTAARSLLLTVDLPWRRDALGYGVTLVFSGLALWLLVEWVRRWQGPDARAGGGDPSLVSTMPWMSVPLLLFLQSEQFGQVSLLASLNGLSFPWAAGWVVLGHLLALALGWALLSRAGMDAGDWPVVLLAGGTLVLALSGIAKGGWMSVAFWPVGQAVAFLLTVFASSGPWLAPSRPGGRWRGTLPVFLGWWAFGALLVASEVQGAAWPHHAAAVLLTFWALWAIRLMLPGQALRLVRRRLWERRGAACGVLLAVLVVEVGTVLLPSPRPTPAPSQGLVRVATYNIRHGFSAQGALDLERLARTLAEVQADVVGLNEVSRGRLLDGGVDVLLWLGHRLGMRAEFGAIVEGLYGNALLSRYPIVGVQNFPFETYHREPRGCLLITVQVGEGQVLTMVTHLDHGEEAAPTRAAQVVELLALWAGRTPAILLGDFNAEPGAPELANLKAAGWVDVVSALQERPAPTIPSPVPVRRTDYIFVTQEVQPVEISVPSSSASDRLPLVATLRLPR
ncbi:MAG: endonuclease/exonuclease/phosphatase family protein [Anaerolineae bacterium]